MSSTIWRQLAVVALSVLSISPARAVAPAARLAPSPAQAATVAPVAAPLLVELEMVDAVSSRSSKPGDRFKLKVVAPVLSNGIVLIPIGAEAVGEVIHANRSGGGGKAGELILAARYVESAQGRIKLRSTFGAAARDRVGAALGLSFAIGPFALIVKGKEMEIPAGTTLSARVPLPLTYLFPESTDPALPHP